MTSASHCEHDGAAANDVHQGSISEFHLAGDVTVQLVEERAVAAHVVGAVTAHVVGGACGEVLGVVVVIGVPKLNGCAFLVEEDMTSHA